MLEIFVVLNTLLLVSAVAAAALYFHRQAKATATALLHAEDAQIRVHQLCQSADRMLDKLDALAVSVEQLPKKSKAGRKPSTSTGAKRGRPPKVRAEPAPVSLVQATPPVGDEQT